MKIISQNYHKAGLIFLLLVYTFLSILNPGKQFLFVIILLLIVLKKLNVKEELKIDKWFFIKFLIILFILINGTYNYFISGRYTFILALWVASSVAIVSYLGLSLINLICIKIKLGGKK